MTATEAGGSERLPRSAPLHGVLVVDKPRGPTSFDVVQRVRRALRVDKAGHTGTLDPMATGVLAVCLGDALKVQQYLVEGDKAYEAEVAFGVATDTEDAEGREVSRADASALTREAIAAALPRFVGEIEQVPPMYSAVRVGGKRLHEAARAGEAVERAPRRVRVMGLDLLAFASERDGLARASLAVRCGKGTYVRTLAADLGRAVGVPAHLAALRRVSAGPFTLAEAVPLDELQRLAAEDRAQVEARVIPVVRALDFMPSVALSGEQARDVAHGRAVQLPELPQRLFRALSPEGTLVAICSAGPRGVQPVRVLEPRRTR
ncbi:MAG TPA: tRNA pseudouridine(55) synthase TruB [Anaeromyxobacteraceae bacterium]|nr:tRNA pseudouridine(55) synthase TruB [Anaeromyxobacteraceae bacterium]